MTTEKCPRSEMFGPRSQTAGEVHRLHHFLPTVLPWIVTSSSSLSFLTCQMGQFSSWGSYENKKVHVKYLAWHLAYSTCLKNA